MSYLTSETYMNNPKGLIYRLGIQSPPIFESLVKLGVPRVWLWLDRFLLLNFKGLIVRQNKISAKKLKVLYRKIKYREIYANSNLYKIRAEFVHKSTRN